MPTDDYPIQETSAFNLPSLAFGQGVIAGKATRADNALPVGARVLLFNALWHPVRETTADPETGAYLFEEVAEEGHYAAIALDDTGT